MQPGCCIVRMATIFLLPEAGPAAGGAHGPVPVFVWEAAIVPTASWFAAICVSETMLADHGRATYEAALRAVAREA